MPLVSFKPHIWHQMCHRGNSPTAQGTLGVSQPITWARLAMKHSQGLSQQRGTTSSIYTQHLLRYNIITATWHMVWSWYITSLAQYIRWVTSWHHRTESQIHRWDVKYRCQLQMSVTDANYTSAHEKKNKKPVSVMGFS